MNDLQILLALYPNEAWDISRLSSNPNIDMNYVLGSGRMDWNDFALSRNSSLDIQDIETYAEYWNYATLSTNPNLTIDFVRSHRGKYFS